MRERVGERLLSGLVFLAALGVSCSSVSGPSVMEEVQYTEGGANFRHRTLSIGADGRFVSKCDCNPPDVEGRLEPGERLRVKVAVDSPSFRDLAPSYSPDLVCVTIPHYIVRVRRGDGLQEVKATGCSKSHPPALDAALDVFSDILERIERDSLGRAN